MNAAVFRMELRRARTLIVWLSVVAVVYAGMVGAIYPVLRDNTKLVTEYMNAFPKEWLATIGMEGSLADHGVFYSTYIGMMLWPILAAMCGIVLATRTTAADVDRGWIELPLSGRLPRVMYLLDSIAVQVVGLAILAAVTVASVLAAGAVVGAGFDAGRFALAGVAAFIWGTVVAAATTLLAVLTLNRGLSAGAVAGALLVMYLVRAIAQIQPSVDWLGWLSLFRYLYPKPIIDDGAFPAGDAMLIGALALLAWAAALVLFRRRDLLA